MARKSEAETMVVAEREDFTPGIYEGIFDPKDTMSGIDLRLQQIGVLHQGQLFLMPDGTKIPSFDGTILDICNVNAWWEIDYDTSGGGTPPQCFSMDGVRPNPLSEKLQAASCSECKLNAFGSDGKRGKACKNMKRIHVMIPGERFPKRLTASPANLKTVNIYGSMLEDQGIPYPVVNTRFGLKEVKNKDGIKYSEIIFEKIGLSAKTAEEARAIKKIRDDFMPFMREDPILKEELSGNDDPAKSE